ncbi:hypothetical protein L210DRAFT_3519340 [Boletus edulis BED1]|uniref:Uncharacterized protein n=1 Tax=Boletus edulis BED1 TaxID=1328754 RepID=A0AAD4C9T1_BOLED|nr:hypothetical protein L210DRAFT_3519340 [Boletus edulis BED1]
MDTYVIHTHADSIGHWTDQHKPEKEPPHLQSRPSTGVADTKSQGWLDQSHGFSTALIGWSQSANFEQEIPLQKNTRCRPDSLPGSLA